MSTAEGTYHQNASTNRMALVVKLDKLNEIFADVSTRMERLRVLGDQLVNAKSEIVH